MEDLIDNQIPEEQHETDPVHGGDQHTHFFLTVNNPTRLLPEIWEAYPGQFRYLVGQLERGANGTPHLQCLVGCTRTRRLAWLRGIFGHGVHAELPRNLDRSILYVQKSRTREQGPWVFGKLPQPKQSRVAPKVAELIRLTHAQRIETLTCPQYNALERAERTYRLHEETPRIDFPWDFHIWQRQLQLRLGVAEDRRITWIFDPVGGSGKTKFAAWYCQEPGRIYITIEKKENLLYMVTGKEDTIIMDIARSELEFLNYATLEKLKDGYWICGKYEGKKVYRPFNANVVVLSNQMPDTDKLSRDRWEIYRIRDNKLEYINL